MIKKNLFFIGKENENIFAECCKKNGILVRKASKNDDVRKHIDFFLEKNGKEIAIDFKGAKKKNRYDKNVNYDLVWVELQNVCGEKGWLYGEADFIVFEQKNEYVFIPRVKLIQFTEKHVNKTIKKEKEKHCYYRRKDRQDIIYWTTFQDIINEFPFNNFYKLQKKQNEIS